MARFYAYVTQEMGAALDVHPFNNYYTDDSKKCRRSEICTHGEAAKDSFPSQTVTDGKGTMTIANTVTGRGEFLYISDGIPDDEL